MINDGWVVGGSNRRTDGLNGRTDESNGRLDYLLRVPELLEDGVIIVAAETIGKADGSFDVGLEGAFQQLVHLTVVIVIMPDAEHALDVVPDGAPEARCINVLLRAHGVVRQVIGQPEFLVDQVTHVAVQSVDQRVGVVIPRIILHPERRYHAFSVVTFTTSFATASVGEILIDEAFVFDELSESALRDVLLR